MNEDETHLSAGCRKGIEGGEEPHGECRDISKVKGCSPLGLHFLCPFFRLAQHGILAICSAQNLKL